MCFRILLLTFAATATSLVAAPGRPVRFEKVVLTDQYLCDGINAADFNRDGHIDVVAGPYWYEGPGFKTKHEFFPMVPQPIEEKPTNSMFSFVYDFDGDGWTDILVLGRVLFNEAYWYRNPGATAVMDPGTRWKRSLVSPRVFGEAPQFLDIDGDGRPEILAISGTAASDKKKQWGWYAPDWSAPERPWRFVAVTESDNFNHYYHGEGVGDIDGDGRLDLVLNEGWWQQPPKSAAPGTLWKKHPFVLSDDRGGAQILVADVNGDRRNDIITAKNAHGWGVSWFEQVRGADGAITFTEHRIMGTREEEKVFGVAFSQPHALTLADINGDGLKDIVTGKRRWAHGPKGDVEPMGTPVNYWFELVRDARAPGGARYVPHLIDDASALGTQVEAVDVNGDGAPDVLTASKLGAFVFLNRRS
ncbi:MAG: VCBS repeat-containing protein [Opitutaceae bacterium]|nr:VCBS repeat-containing protein [Opitutaceae bacterium]